jgi:hypothetical protein
MINPKPQSTYHLQVSLVNTVSEASSAASREYQSKKPSLSPPYLHISIMNPSPVYPDPSNLIIALALPAAC